MSGDYSLITDVNQLHKLSMKMLESGAPIGFDTESGYSGNDFNKRATDHFHPDQFAVGFSFSTDQTWGRYVPLAHDSGGNVDSVKDAWDAVREMLTKGHIVSHNARFEFHVVKKAANIDLAKEGKLTDTMLDAYVLGHWALNGRTVLGLKDLVLELCGHQMMHIEELWPDLAVNKKQALRFNTLELTPEVVAYACEDAAWVLALSKIISPLAQKERPVMRGLEHKITQIMRDIEIQGVSVDWDALKEAYAKGLSFNPNMENAVKAGLGEMADRDLSELNLRSPMQVKRLLYSDLGLGTTRMTKGGKDPEKEAKKEPWEKMSTDAKALKTLSDEYPAIKKLLEYKEVQTTLNSRFKKWVNDYDNKIDGKVHPNYKQAGTEDQSADAPGTGRFSANEPAIQGLQKELGWSTRLGVNLTTKELWKKQLAEGENGVDYWATNYRNFIVASPDTYLLTYDYSQVELRMLAGVSQEPALLEAFAKGTDIHTVTAAQMLGMRVEDVDPEIHRPVGKAQPLDSKILTPTGWRCFGDLTVGDYVIGADGKAVEVNGIFPQGKKKVFELTMSDGAIVECCDEHLWTVKNINTKNAQWQTKELKDIVKSGLLNTNNQPKYQLPARPVIQYVDNPELPMDPYVLGMLLGDGGFTHDWGVMFASMDREMLDAVQVEHERLGGKISSEFEQHEGFWRFYLASGTRNASNATTQILRDLGLWMKKADTKFVPEIYLRAKPEDRLAMLQGLLDTDGNVLASGAEFKVTSKELALAVQELARSLGGSAYYKTIQREADGNYNKKTPLLIHYVYLRLPEGFVPFRVKRKVDSWKPPKYSTRQSILRVREVMPAEVQCISVSSKDGLYVTSDYIVTHNTMNFA